MTNEPLIECRFEIVEDPHCAASGNSDGAFLTIEMLDAGGGAFPSITATEYAVEPQEMMDIMNLVKQTHERFCREYQAIRNRYYEQEATNGPAPQRP